MESAIEAIDNKATERIVDKKEMVKIEVREELKKDLVSRERFDETINGLCIEMRERFNVVDKKFKSLNLRLNIFLAIALIALTFASPNFVALIQKLF